MNKLKYFIFFFIIVISIYAEVIDKIEVIVGNDIILKSEIDEGMKLLNSPLFSSQQKDSLKNDYINSLIDNKVLYLIAEEESIKVDTNIIYKEVENYVENMINNFPDKEAYRTFLKANNLDENMLKQFYFKQKEIMYIKQQLIFKKGYNINVNEKQIREFYDSNRDSFNIPLTFDLYHISFVVRPDSLTFMGTLQKVDALINALKSGKTFEELAKQYSDDKRSATRGGYVGKIAYKDMKQEIANFLYQFQNSDTLLYTQSRNGFHIIKILNTYTDSVEYKEIFIKFNTTREDTLRVRKKANNIRNMILNKQLSFEEAALKYSDDIMTKQSGGYVGKVNYEQLQDNLKRYLKNLEENQVSEIIKGEFGFELFMIKNKEGGTISNYEDIKQFIRNMLESREIDKYIKQLIEEKKKHIYIKFMNE